jgi:hypothetical protein
MFKSSHELKFLFFFPALLRQCLIKTDPSSGCPSGNHLILTSGKSIHFLVVPGNEHSEQARVPHTHEPRDVPQCGAPSLIEKPLHHRGFRQNLCPAFVYVGIGPAVARARVLVYEVLYRGAQAASCGGACRASQVLGRGAQADARGDAQLLYLVAQAVARSAAR